MLSLAPLDLFGGAAANATTAARRWWHRPTATKRQQFTFVACHVHPLVLAMAVGGYSWPAGLTTYALLVVGTFTVLSVDASIERPVAYAVCVIAVTIHLMVFQLPSALVWFTPVLMTKLFLSHLIPDWTHEPTTLSRLPSA